MTYNDVTGSGVSKVRYCYDGTWDTEDWEPPSSTFWTSLGSGDGTRTVYYQIIDNVGNIAGINPIIYDSIILDTTAPIGTITINDGAAYTTSTSATLSLACSDATSGVYKVRYSNDGTFDTEPWEDPTESKAWTLSSYGGPKTVYYQVIDNAENARVFSDDIVLDTLVPSGDIKINSENPTFTISQFVTLYMNYADSNGISDVRYSNDGIFDTESWESPSSIRAWTLTGGDGWKSVYYQVRDRAGLTSVFSDTINLDTTFPIGSISINSGTAYTTAPSVTLSLTYNDGNGISNVSYSNDGIWDTETWETPVATKAWTLTGGDGPKTVYCRIKDIPGNTATFSDTITLDTTPPSGSIKINSGDTYTGSTSATLTLTYSDATSGVSQARYSNDGSTWSSWEPPTASKPWTLTPGEGTKTVYYQIKDNVALVSSTYSDTIILSISGPTGSITINNGDSYTMSTSATLSLTYADPGPGVSQVRYSNDGTWDTETWETPAPTKAWTLTSGDGTKTVYYQVKNTLDAASPTYSDTIMLDTTPSTGSITINNGDTYATAFSATLTLTYTDATSGVAQMRFSNDGSSWSTWEAASPTKTWTLTSGDGSKTVYFQVKDNAGLASVSYSDTITIDTTAPTGSITINNGDASTSTVSVTLTLTQSDTGSGVSQVRYSNDGTWDTEPWETPLTTKAWTLTAGDGAKTVYYQVKDNAGLTSTTYSDSITLQTPDTTPPTGSITINDGAATTTSVSVTLTLSATDSESGVAQMRFSNDGASWSSWEAYATGKAWTLSSGDGSKTVYAQFKNGAGLDSTSYSDSITLQSPTDTTPPTGSIIINGGDASTSSPSVTLTLSATDSESGVSQMRFSNDASSWSGWEPYATSKSWILSSGDGAKTVYVQFKNGAGLDSVSYSDGITLQSPTDTTPPTGSITINGGAGTTSSVSVSLTLSAADPESGVAQMRFSNDGSSWSTWETYSTIKSWTLTSGDGTKTVYAQFKNGAGLDSASYSDTITLQSTTDTTPPTGSIIINGGAATTSSASVTLTLSATDNTGVVAQMHFSNVGESWTAWEPYATSKAWTLTSGLGEKTVLAQFKDGAGLESAIYADSITLSQFAETSSFNVSVSGSVYVVAVTSNSSVSDFTFNQGLKRIRFSVNGTSGTSGFVQVSIPPALMSGDFSVYLDDVLLSSQTGYLSVFNSTHQVFLISYAHSSHWFEIFSTNVVPEFQSAAVLILLLMATSAFAFAMGGKRRVHGRAFCARR